MRPPIALRPQVDHGLAQEVLFVGILDLIHLIDDIDQVPRLGHAPEHAVDPDQKIPLVLNGTPVSLAQVGMGSFAVLAVEPKKRDEFHLLALVVASVAEFGR